MEVDILKIGGVRWYEDANDWDANAMSLDLAHDIAKAPSRSQENGILGDPANHDLSTRVFPSTFLTFIVHPY